MRADTTDHYRAPNDMKAAFIVQQTRLREKFRSVKYLKQFFLLFKRSLNGFRIPGMEFLLSLPEACYGTA